MTPFLKRLKSDAAFRKAAADTEFSPEDPDDFETWVDCEKDIHREKALRLGDEWSPWKHSLDLLSYFPSLVFLELAITPKTDLKPLRSLKNLKELNLRGKSKGALDLSFVSELKKLEKLDVRGPFVESLDALASIPSLTKIGVTEGKISSIASLAKMKKLEQVFLPNQKLTSIDALTGKTGLRYVQLPGNQVSDVTPLAGAKVLRFLGLKDNAVRDVSALAGLESVETLYLEGNPIADFTPLRALKKVTTKDFKITAPKAGSGAAAGVTLKSELRARLDALAETDACRTLLAKLLTRVNDVSEKKGVTTLRFDADDHSVIPFVLEAPFAGDAPDELPPSVVTLIKQVGKSVHVDASRPGVDGPKVGVGKSGALLCDLEWDGVEDRERFQEFCNAGQNWFVLDTKKPNKRGEPAIVFFSHEGALDPKRRFPMQDQLSFGAGGFVLRALAFRVFGNDKKFSGCGWG
ncbi:MAG: leucine-rich repeat domain-containing protein [Archangium sp.]